MKKYAKFLILFLLLAAIIYGCAGNHTTPVYRAVTQVDIVTEYKDQLIHRHYNTPEKMRPVLLYLRLLKPQGKPVNVDDTSDDVYLISISLSNGNKRYYRQAAHQYFSKNNGPWKAIDPGQAAQLYKILQTFPSDI